MKKIDEEYRKSLYFLIQWMIISVTAGISGALLVGFFYLSIRTGSSVFSSSYITFPYWTIGGALVSGLVFYRISPSASGDGIPSYINGLLEHRGYYSSKETLCKFFAATMALFTLNSGGMLGPSGRISAGISTKLTRILTKTGLIEGDRRTAAICGMSAAVGAVFNSPVGGGIFAVEVLQRANMRYSDLFPAVLSSSIAVYVYNHFPFPSPLQFSVPEGLFKGTLILPILVTSLAAAYTGRLYTLYFSYVSRMFRKGNKQKIVLKLFIGGTCASVAVFLFSPQMAGNMKDVISSLLSGEIYPVRDFFSGNPSILIYLGFIVVIATSSVFSIASGISVGLTSPSVLIGLFLGAIMASILGVEASDYLYYFLLVAGFTGLLSSTINVPLSAAVIAIESFGASYGFCAGISSIIGFQVNRHHTLYEYTVSYTD